MKEEEDLIRAKWILDGSRSLAEAAARARAFADHLEALNAEGWELAWEMHDDYGVIQRTVS